ncbi:MAG: tetratricopeptide repeat protein [Rhodothermales bacterium]
MEDTDLERWNRVHAVFDRALDLPAEARLPYLQKTCDLDETLRQEVEELLRATSPADDFLETPLSDLIRAMLDEIEPAEAAESAIGQRIGPYRLLEHIGSGGMGAVYRAERDDGHYQKRVAVKLIRPEVTRADALERFRSERQILADLEHAAIARLLDGGVAEVEAGAPERPYFVMEYVDGLPIDVYCDKYRLSVGKRLTLFRAVCEAVQYAHRNLVIHRDLKPSNILVTKEGKVKLLDFGIAQVMDAESSGDGATSAILAPARMMTPEYAAPEQVRGEKITTSADVYVLGVLLYELLTGHRPYQPKNHRRREVERVVLEEIPVQPSTKVGTSEERIGRTGDVEQLTPKSVSEARASWPRRLARRLRGDLDRIVLKALQKAPEQRYASVEQLSEDVRRHLEGMPVKARQGRTGYHAMKFVGRNRVVVAAVVLTVLSLALGLGYAVHQKRVALEQRHVALEQERIAAEQRDYATWAAAEAFREKQKAERITDFIVSVFQGVGSSTRPNQSVKASDLLRQGAQRVEVELQGDPEVQAEMLEVLGEVSQSLTFYKEAMPLLERALSTQRQLYNADHPKMASTVYQLALLQQRSGNYDAAEPLFKESLAIRRRLYRVASHPDVAESLHGLAGIYHRKGRYAEAEPLYREALRQRRVLYGNHHAIVAKNLEHMGWLLRFKGQYDEADEAFREALAIHERFPEKEVPIVNASSHVATMLTNRGAYDEAEPMLREVLATWKKVYGDEHLRTATANHNLAELLYHKGAYAEAEPLYREALAGRRAIFGDVHASTALTATQLADLLTATGTHAEADSLYRFALESVEGAFSKEHVRASYPLSGLGQLRIQQGRLTEAERHLREALRLRQEKFPEGHPHTATAKVLLGRCLAEVGRMEEAVPLLAEGYATLEDRLGDAHPATGQARRWIEEAHDFENTLTEVPDQIPVPATIRNE